MGYALNCMSLHDYRSPTVTPLTPDEMRQKLEQIEDVLRVLSAQSGETLTAIRGNEAYGHAGLVREVRDLKESHRTLKEAHEQNDRKLFRFGTIFTLAWAIIGAALLLGKDLLVSWITNGSRGQ